MARSHVFRYLDSDGDGGGTKNMSVNGSITPQEFKYIPVVGGHVEIHRMLVHVRDTGAFTADGFGALSVLSNGVTFCIKNSSDDSVAIDLLDGIPIKSNASWNRVCYDTRLDTHGSGDNYLAICWTFANSGTPFRIDNGEEYISMTVNDDLSGLVEFYAQLQGVRV